MKEEFLVFLDETGDHSLQHIDKQYPIFALGALFCETDTYIKEINPLFDELKYNFFNKRHVILHSTDIRNSRKDFKILMNPNIRKLFFEELNKLIKETRFYFIISLIDKQAHSTQYIDPDNPYELTLSFIMERAFYLIHKNYPSAKCRFIAESRDKKENENLKQSFEKYKRNGTNYVSAEELSFITELDFVPKNENETGHQIVDLCLYPLARTYLTGKCHQSLPYFYNKIYKNPDTKSPIGYGIKIFPTNLSKNLIKKIEKNVYDFQ